MSKKQDVSNEKVVSSKDFSKLEESLKKKTTILLIHAVWCGHCMHFKPEWAKLTASLTGIKFMSIESSVLEQLKTKNPSLFKYVTETSTSKGIYFPKLIIFKNGKKIEYQGNRDVATLTAYLEKLKPKTKTTTKKNSIIAAPIKHKKIGEEVIMQPSVIQTNIPALIDKMVAKLLNM